MKRIEKKPFLMTLLATSAGQPALLHQLLESLPAEAPISLLLFSEEPQALQPVLQKTAFSVRRLRDRVEPLVGHLYLLPPNLEVRWQEGRLEFGNPPLTAGPVDIMLRSLSASGEGAAAVVLGNPGQLTCMGLRSLRRAGGLTLACPGSDELDPVVTRAVHREAGPRQAARLLLRWAERLSGPPAEPTHKQLLGALERLAEQLETSDPTQLPGLPASLRRRALVCELPLEAYIQKLKNEAGEAERLLAELRFTPPGLWQGRSALNSLAEQVDKIVAGRTQSSGFRIWVPECHRGEEAYSIASLVRDRLDRSGHQQTPLQVFATDSDFDCLRHARGGLYAGGSLPPGPDSYFTRLGENWKVTPRLRDSCIFSVHHPLEDPPFGRLQLLVCRWLKTGVAESFIDRMLSIFFYALEPGGLLFLGEPFPQLDRSRGFAALDAGRGIYQALPGRRRLPSGHPLRWSRRRRAQTQPDARAAKEELAATEEHLDWTLEELSNSLRRQMQLNRAMQRKVSELDQVQQELKQANSRLQEHSHRKDEFIATLAHELRNPLAPIVNSLHLLSQVDEDERRSLIKMLGSQAQHLSRMVDDLLDMARLQRGDLPIKRKPLELTRVVREAGRLWLMGNGSSQLDLDICEGPVVLSADEERLKQVVFNLLNNACSHNRPGQPIKLSLQTLENTAELRVSDQGKGIDPAMLDSIFEPFVQAEKNHDRPTGGLGIGLSVTQAIVANHGGVVSAHSEGIGRGATFRILLPLPEQPPRLVPPSSSPASTEPLRILVVEDNPIVARSLAMMLRSWGHQVAIAGDGTEAIDEAQRLQPNAAILDIGLPGKDGHQVLAELLELPDSQLELAIALSGYDMPADGAGNFQHYLTKPAPPQKLRQLLGRPD